MLAEAVTRRDTGVPTPERASSALDVDVRTRGWIGAEERECAQTMVGAVLAHLKIPADNVRMRLTGANCAGGPVLVQVNLRVCGAPARIQVPGRNAAAAIAVGAARLRRQIRRLSTAWEPWPWPDPERRSLGVPGPGQIARVKTFRLHVGMPCQAIAVTNAMDYDVYLYTDAETGEDAIVYRAGSTGLRLARQRRMHPPSMPVALPLTINSRKVPVLTPAEAADDPQWSATGDPLEAALVALAARCGLDPYAERAAWPRVDEHHFETHTRRMTTAHDTPAVGGMSAASLHRSPARASRMSASGNGGSHTPSGPVISPVGSYPVPATAYSSPSALTTRWAAIRPSVSVPVLSDATTVTEPSVSTACRRRGIACRRAIRRAPSARARVTTAGRDSGTAATTRLTAVIAMSTTGRPAASPSANTTPETTTAAASSSATSGSVSCMSTRLTRRRGRGRATAFGPSAARRRAASAALSPVGFAVWTCMPLAWSVPGRPGRGAGSAGRDPRPVSHGSDGPSGPVHRHCPGLRPDRTVGPN